MGTLKIPKFNAAYEDCWIQYNSKNWNNNGTYQSCEAVGNFRFHEKIWSDFEMIFKIWYEDNDWLKQQKCVFKVEK